VYLLIARPNPVRLSFVDFDDRAALLAAAPDAYVTDHYADYSAVLVRLSRVDPDVLRHLLGVAYKFVTRKAAPHSRVQKGRKLGPRR
jgi:hypothetical protein